MDAQIKELYLEYLKSDNLYDKYRIKLLLEEMKISLPKSAFLKDILLKIEKEFVPNQIEKLVKEEKKRKKRFVHDNQKIWEMNIPTMNNVEEKNYYFVSKNMMDMLKKLEMFLQKISPELFWFYKALNEKQMVIIDSKRKDNITYVLYANNTIIMINKLNNYDDLVRFVNEIGYAYYNYLNNVHLNETFHLDYDIKAKIPGKILELLLIQFLYQNKMYSSPLNIERKNIAQILENQKMPMSYTKMQKDLTYYVSSYYAKIYGDLSLEKIFQNIYTSDSINLIKYCNSNINNQDKIKKKIRK